MSVIHHVESQKLTSLHSSGQKTIHWVMMTAASVVELAQDSQWKTPPYFVRQYKFPEILKNHLAEEAKCSRTSDVLYHWQLQV